MMVKQLLLGTSKMFAQVDDQKSIMEHRIDVTTP